MAPGGTESEKQENGMRKVLFFHVGSIGDTIVAMPAMHAVLEHLKDARIDLFNAALIEGHVHQELYKHLNWFSRMNFTPTTGNLIQRTLTRCRIIHYIYEGHYDTVFYFAYAPRQIDFLLFSLLGIRNVFCCLDQTRKEIPIYRNYLETVASYGFRASKPFQFVFTDQELKSARELFLQLNIPADRIPIAVGIGGKQDACHWPIEKYRQVLCHDFGDNGGLFPVFLGSDKERNNVELLMNSTGCGFFLQDAPNLSLRETIAFLKMCRFYLGNDTGSIHMAAAAGIPCIGIYSARNAKGLWEPFGENNLILRTRIDCERCERSQCRYGSPSRCIDAIPVERVVQAVNTFLQRYGASLSAGKR